MIAGGLCFRRQSGVWLAVAGISLNFLAILANGGLMPVSASEIAPHSQTALGFAAGSKSIVVSSQPAWIAPFIDRFAVGLPIGTKVFSVGDVLILTGVAIATLKLAWSTLKG